MLSGHASGGQSRLNDVTVAAPGPSERGWTRETLASDHCTRTMACNHELCSQQRDGQRLHVCGRRGDGLV
jgi:hypothetical protein